MSNTEPITTKEALLRDWQGKLLDVQRFLDAYPQFAIPGAQLRLGAANPTITINDLSEDRANALSGLDGFWVVTRSDHESFDLLCASFPVTLRLNNVQRATPLTSETLPRPYKP